MAETIANGIGAIKKAESTLEDTLTKQLDAAKKHGLTAAMLYKGTKDAPSLMWNVFTDTLSNLCNISTSTRDNYLSRIRKYVDGKTNELDLFDRKGQEAARKAREARHSNASAPVVTDAASVTERESGSPKNKAVQRGVEEKLIGLPAFQQFATAWLAANPVGTISAKYRDMIVDLTKAIEEITTSK